MPRHDFVPLVPVDDLIQGNLPEQWTVTRGSPRFHLLAAEEVRVGGWFLIHTRVIRRTSGYSAALYCQIDDSEARIWIPVSLKGNVNEIIKIPAGTKAIYWSPMSAQGELLQYPVTLRRIGLLARTYRMYRRIFPMLWNERKEKLEALGVSFADIFVDIESIYGAAGRLRAYGSAPTYPEWIANTKRLLEPNQSGWASKIKKVSCDAKLLAVVCCQCAEGDEVQRTISALARAGIAQDAILLVGASEAFRNNHAGHLPAHQVAEIEWDQVGAHLKASKSKFVSWLRAGDVVSSSLLCWLAAEMISCPNAALIYFDHDSIDSAGERTDPNFKPDWSPELLRSTNYIGRGFVVRTTVVNVLAGQEDFAELNTHSLLARAVSNLASDQIRHIPALLLHQGRPEPEIGAGQLSDLLGELGTGAGVEQTARGCYRIRYRLPAYSPKISILIPTKDAVALLMQCVSSILAKSSYAKYEIVILDNRSSDVEAIAYLDAITSDPRVRVLRYDAPFNFAAINNFAAQRAEGEVLCLLNNDTEVISPDWMEEMLGHLVQEKVGVVGAKLLYPDGRVQHGGDVVGVGGVANHLHAFLGRDDPGYCNRAIVAQDLSAVTAACLMTWRKLYLDLGGLDELNLPVAFNDVDYCLRVRESGKRVVWTPHAELFHHESVSRGKDDTPEKKARAKREVAYMRKRWNRELQHDPFYNPNLSYQRADFSLSHAPLVRRPWHR